MKAQSTSLERRRNEGAGVPIVDARAVHSLLSGSCKTDVSSLRDTSKAMKVMVVDDDPVNVTLLSTMLESAGYEVQSASSAEEYLCLYAASNGRVDVLLTDINMPGGMSGFDLLEHMESVDKSLSVVVMTAQDEYDNVRQALSLGAQGYVAKPFGQTEEVLQTIRSAAAATRLVRENDRLLERLNAQNEQLLALAISDPLTNVYNRRHIDAVFDAHIKHCADHGLPFSVVMFDIDNFKAINDKFGHDIGDEVLVRVADIVRSSVRSEDSIGRYGGEEFIVVAPDTTPSDAENLAIRIRKRIETTEIVSGQTKLSVTASFGVSGAGTMCAGINRYSLLKEADIAVYAAKESGRNRVVKRHHS